MAGLTYSNCKSTLNIEFEQDRSVGLGATLRDRQEIKNYFSCFNEFFRGKANRAILLRVEYAINPQNLMKIVVAIFEKMKV